MDELLGKGDIVMHAPCTNINTNCTHIHTDANDGRDTSEGTQTPHSHTQMQTERGKRLQDKQTETSSISTWPKRCSLRSHRSSRARFFHSLHIYMRTIKHENNTFKKSGNNQSSPDFQDDNSAATHRCKQTTPTSELPG